MTISGGFIKRPIMTTLVMAAILIFGIFAYRLLPVSDLPNVDFPTIQVNASLPGASPDTMASSVATPLEKQFSTIAGIDSMTSTNVLGNTNITIQFNLSRSLDGAALDVQSAISQAQGQLPPEMPTPPSFRKVNPADSPILYLALSSPTLKLSDVDEAAETTIAQRLSMVNGVAQVSVFGAQKYAVRVQVDPQALASRQIGIDEVTTALQAGNSNVPTGTLYASANTFTILSNGKLSSASQFGPMIVAYRNGAPVRLNELGRVIDSVQENKTASWYNGNRAIVLAILRQPGTNTVEVVDNIKKVLPQLEQQIPAAITVSTLYDRSVSIRSSVNDVKFTLMLTICLVVMVIFVFLRNVSATIIPSLALPMSIIGTFSVMYLLGYSVDNLSLMALTLSVGFVVDDAIVMLENIVRHMEMGKTPMQAAVDGSTAIGFTILSMTISLAAVFIPLLFMVGIVGRLLDEFVVTIGVAILVSGFISISLTPMLCSRFLKPPHAQRHGWFYNVTERIFERWLRLYDWTLRVSLRHRAVTMAISLALLAGTAYLFMLVPKGFLPTEDQGRFSISTEAIQGIGFDDMVRHQQQVAEIVGRDPNVSGFSSNVGGGPGGGGGLNTGRISADLKPRRERKLSVDKIATLGLTVNQVETALYNAYGTRQVSQIYAPNNQYQVILQVAPEFQKDPAALSLLYVRSSSGRLIPLDTVAKVRTDAGPLSVSHTGQLPSVTISFNLKPGSSLGDAVTSIQSAAATALPSTVSTTFQGTAQAFQDSLRGLGLILLMAIVVIYIVLGILYESFTHPLTILSGLPSAGFGALLTLLLFRTELSLYAFVGVIMLVGLVKKNGIMMVDFAVEAQREHGKTPLEAIHEACLVRFRPIMTTTMAALVGTMPIALGLGAGAEPRRPLGLAVVAGTVASPWLTLYITPVYYVYIEGARLRLTGHRLAAVPPPARATTSAEEPALALHRKVEGSRGRA